MSSTMTMNLPESAVSFLTQKGMRSRDEIGAMFVAFLTEKMGYVPDVRPNPFSDFCGTWDDEQFAEFQSVTKRTVNAEDWQ